MCIGGFGEGGLRAYGCATVVAFRSLGGKKVGSGGEMMRGASGGFCYWFYRRVFGGRVASRSGVWTRLRGAWR